MRGMVDKGRVVYTWKVKLEKRRQKEEQVQFRKRKGPHVWIL